MAENKKNIYLNTRKSEGGIFIRDSREKEKDLKPEDDGERVKTGKEVLFLGIKVDQGLTFVSKVESGGKEEENEDIVGAGGKCLGMEERRNDPSL